MFFYDKFFPGFGSSGRSVWGLSPSSEFACVAITNTAPITCCKSFRAAMYSCLPSSVRVWECWLGGDVDGLGRRRVDEEGGRGSGLLTLMGSPSRVHTSSSPGRASGRGGIGETVASVSLAQYPRSGLGTLRRVQTLAM